MIWDYLLDEDFDDPALDGWSPDPAGGLLAIGNSALHMQERMGGASLFPLLWRNDAFPIGEDFILEMRFRFPQASPYGVAVGLGSRPYDGTRYFAGEAPIPGVEDILSIRHSGESFRILFRQLMMWEGAPGDDGWHHIRLEREGTKYILTVDGIAAGRIASAIGPVSLTLGDPAIQSVAGPWTHLEVDYIKVAYCAAWGTRSLYLPLVVKAP